MNAPAFIGSTGTGPVQENERIETIDVLRGFALFGILLVNIGFFAFPLSEPFYLAPDAGSLDATLHWLTAWLAQGKFYPLFSLLFGMGFAMQMDRADARGLQGRSIHARRLAVLFLIGIVHALLIWAGDILTVYAVLGFVLLLFAHAPARSLMIAAIASYGLQLLLTGMFMFAMAAVYANPEAASETLRDFDAARNEMLALRADAWTAYSSGTFMDVTRIRMREFGMMLQNLAFFGFQILGMFLLGAWFGRNRILANPLRHRRLLKTLLVLSVVVGLPVSFVFANLHASVDYLVPSPVMAQSFFLNLIAGPLIALGYLAVIVFAMQSRAAGALRLLAPVGRMALSNYLLQSLVCTLIFYSYGFGLFAQPGTSALVVLVFSLFAVQVVLSHWWLTRFRFGPAEWLWRSFVYLELQPLRRDISVRVRDADRGKPG